MTANEIRELQSVIEQSLQSHTPNPLARLEETGLGICFWLAEIALQLARQNDGECERSL